MKCEWSKIFSAKHKRFLILLLAVNLFLMILQGYGPGAEIPPKIYREIFREMKGMSGLEKYRYLKKNSEEQIQSILAADYIKQSLTEELAEEAAVLSDYETYLSNMEESLGKKAGISIFGGNDSFTRRNAEKMKKVYESLHGLDVQFEACKGIEMADMTVTNILVLFLVVYLSAGSLISERENGMLTLLRCCKRGRGWLLRNKMAALTAGIFLISGLFLVENLLFGAAVYGTGSLGRPLQSVPGFEGCPFRVSVFVFLIFVWILRSLGLMLVSVFVLLVTVYMYQMNFVLGSCVMAGGISYFLYDMTGLRSKFVFLHYVNPVALLKAIPLLKGEVNLNIGGFPVTPLTVAGVAGICFWMAGSLWLFLRFERNREARAAVLPKWKHTRKKRYRIGVGAGEAYKLLVTRKGALFLAAAFALQIYLYPERSYITPPGELYETYCIRELKGEIGNRQIHWLREEEERVMEEGDSRQVEREILYSKIMPLTEHLTNLKFETGNAAYIPQTGYEKLFGEGDRTIDYKNTLLYVLLMLCTVSAYISMEKKTNMTALIGPTRTGWRSVKNQKRFTVVLFAVVSMIAVWIPDWIWIFKTYGIRQWNAPLTWLFMFMDTGTGMTVEVYFTLLILIRLLGSVVTGLLMLWISERSRSETESYGLNAIIFLVPAVLALLGIPYVEQFTFSALLDGNAVLKMIL